SVLRPNFQLTDPTQYGIKGAKTNKRFEIMRDYNGLLICRERRQIDTVPPRWTKFQNYDANIKIEIDFDPELDEFFGITTAKQKAVERAEVTGEPTEKVVEDIKKELEARRWAVEFTAIPEGPFYRPTRLGEQKRLVINTDHPFYTKVYAAAPEAKAALEVLLF